MPDINNDFSKMCVQIMKGRSLTLSELKEKAPRGFWEAVRQELNDAQISMPEGGQWEKGSQLSQHWKRNETEIAAVISELLGEEITEPQDSESSEELKLVPKGKKIGNKQSDMVSREEFEEFKVSVQELMATLTPPVGATIYQTGQKESENQRPLAPAPPLIGKKLTVPRGKVGFTVDSTLLDLVEKDAAARGVNMGRMLDTVIWHYYGCPPLSFQKESDQSETREE